MSKSCRNISLRLRRVFALDNHPVGVIWHKNKAKRSEVLDKTRMCRAIINASKGQTVRLSRKNNSCFGAVWHLGFERLDGKKEAMVRKFVVEGEKLFSSYRALDNLISDFEDLPDNKDGLFILSPLKDCRQPPQIVVFLCNPDIACRLLTFVTFFDGKMPGIKIGGPTCRMAIMYPLIKKAVNISFYDYTARRVCAVEKDKLLVTVPYKTVVDISNNIDKCSAGTAFIEYPSEFKNFLRKRRKS